MPPKSLRATVLLTRHVLRTLTSRFYVVIVCRRKPGHSNKLEYHYSGPYRVEKVLGPGKYLITDLENKMIKDEIHVSNLKPHYTKTNLVPVEMDEYLIDSLLDRRGLGNDRQYLVK